MKTKPFWQSTTLWFNLLSLILVLYNQFEAIIPPKFAPLAAAIVAVVNALIRLSTSSKLTMTKEAP